MLPVTYHELNSRVRKLFPIDLSTEEYTVKEVKDILKEYYIFKNIPNDYFKQKPLLPKDLQKINLNSKFTYPITDNDKAKDKELKDVLTNSQFQTYLSKKQEIKKKFKENLKQRHQAG